MTQNSYDLFQNYSNEITCIYGEASTGKTTIAKLAAIEISKKGKKVIYIDTENSFNLDRIKQLAGDEFEKILDNIILFKPKRFSEQNKIIRSLPAMKNISLIIIDTVSHFYRVRVREKPRIYNMWMRRQFGILSELSKNIPVIITNQVYNNINKKGIEMIGGEMLKGLSDRIIRLEKEPRKIIFERPVGEAIKFEIVREGLKIIT